LSTFGADRFTTRTETRGAAPSTTCLLRTCRRTNDRRGPCVPVGTPLASDSPQSSARTKRPTVARRVTPGRRSTPALLEGTLDVCNSPTRYLCARRPRHLDHRTNRFAHVPEGR